MRATVRAVTIDEEVRTEIYRLFEGGSVDAFEEWFVGRAWDDRTPLIAAVDHVLAERDLLDNSELVIRLKDFVNTIEVNPIHHDVVTSASASTVRTTLRTVGSSTITRRIAFAGT